MPFLSPLIKQHFDATDGSPLAGGKIFTYSAGTTSKITTWTSADGATPNVNPVILNTRGEADIWITPGTAYKFVVSPSTDTDPPTNAILTEDNVTTAPLTPIISPTTPVSPSLGLLWLDTSTQPRYTDSNQHKVDTMLDGVYSTLQGPRPQFVMGTSYSDGKLTWHS